MRRQPRWNDLETFHCVYRFFWAIVLVKDIITEQQKRILATSPAEQSWVIIELRMTAALLCMAIGNLIARSNEPAVRNYPVLNFLNRFQGDIINYPINSPIYFIYLCAYYSKTAKPLVLDALKFASTFLTLANSFALVLTLAVGTVGECKNLMRAHR